jgi:hypothetical protein
MAKDPAFLFYSSDFLTGVSDLTMDERGQYITLLCLHHQKGRLSRKAIKIATPNATADVLAKFSQDESGLFFNKRLEDEQKKRAEHSKKQADRAKKGWEKRRSPSYATADATALPLENENESVNRIKDKGEKEEKAKIELWPSFEDFWDLYDKKIGRPKAESKWDKLKQKTKEEIMSYLPAYVSATERDNKKYRKNPTTFLNNQSWKDEIIEDRKATPKDRRENLTNLLHQRGHIPSNV